MMTSNTMLNVSNKPMLELMSVVAVSLVSGLSKILDQRIGPETFTSKELEVTTLSIGLSDLNLEKKDLSILKT